MAYTAEDFETAINVAQASALAGSPYSYDDIAYTALRIASAVVRLGVIEQAMFEFKYNDPPALADAIRAALTDAKP